MVRIRFRSLAGLLVLALACCLPASADITFFDNLGRPTAGASGNNFDPENPMSQLWWAQRFNASKNEPIDLMYSLGGGPAPVLWISADLFGPFQMKVEGDGAAVASVTAALFDDVGPAVTRPFSLAIYTDIWNDIFGQFEPGELVGTLTMADALPLPTGPDRGPDGKIVGVTFTATGIPITPHGNYWVVLPGYADASAPNGEVEWAYTTVPEPGVPETLALMVGVVGMLGITRRFRR